MTDGHEPVVVPERLVNVECHTVARAGAAAADAPPAGRVEVHQGETAGITSAAKRSRLSRSKGARIARMTYDAPAST